jgi:hypothetical protein
LESEGIAVNEREQLGRRWNSWEEKEQLRRRRNSWLERR